MGWTFQRWVLRSLTAVFGKNLSKPSCLRSWSLLPIHLAATVTLSTKKPLPELSPYWLGDP